MFDSDEVNHSLVILPYHMKFETFQAGMQQLGLQPHNAKFKQVIMLPYTGGFGIVCIFTFKLQYPYDLHSGHCGVGERSIGLPS